MRFINLIFLFCISSNALAASWIEAGDAIYVDVNSIKKDKGLVFRRDERLDPEDAEVVGRLPTKPT